MRKLTLAAAVLVMIFAAILARGTPMGAGPPERTAAVIKSETPSTLNEMTPRRRSGSRGPYIVTPPRLLSPDGFENLAS